MEAISLYQTPKTRGKIVSMHSTAKCRDSILKYIVNTGKLVLPTASGFQCIRFEDIIFLKAQSNYTEVHTKERKHLFSKTLKAIAVQLPENLFCRVHKSYMVNAAYIQAYVSTGSDPHLVLENEICVPVSRSARGKLRSHWE